jgi:hypothetical protein
MPTNTALFGGGYREASIDLTADPGRSAPTSGATPILTGADGRGYCAEHGGTKLESARNPNVTFVLLCSAVQCGADFMSAVIDGPSRFLQLAIQNFERAERAGSPALQAKFRALAAEYRDKAPRQWDRRWERQGPA